MAGQRGRIILGYEPDSTDAIDLCGVDVFAWAHATVPVARRVLLPAPNARPTGRITYWLESLHCIHCGVRAATPPVCDACAATPDFLAVEHIIRERGLERRRLELERSLAVVGLGPRALPAGLHLVPSQTSLEGDRLFEYRRVLDAIDDNERRWQATLKYGKKRQRY